MSLSLSWFHSLESPPTATATTKSTNDQEEGSQIAHIRWLKISRLGGAIINFSPSLIWPKLWFSVQKLKTSKLKINFPLCHCIANKKNGSLKFWAELSWCLIYYACIFGSLITFSFHRTMNKILSLLLSFEGLAYAFVFPNNKKTSSSSSTDLQTSAYT